MLIRDEKIYRNLQEQVLKNKDDIEYFKQYGVTSALGIKILNAENPLKSVSELPTNYWGDYGDAYLVGTEPPYSMYIWSRSNEAGKTGFWFAWGVLNGPSDVPGIQGPPGPQGPAGARGSLWYSQSGAPTNTTGVNNNDQALDGTNGNVYQFVNGAWQLTGNIRGIPGLQGPQGPAGSTGAPGQQGPQGPKGDQGQFIEILGTLESTSQLPLASEAPRYAAYLIPDSTGVEHIWLIVGNTTLTWHDAGGFGAGGSSILIDGVSYSDVDLKDVANGAMSYQIGETTAVTSNGSEITFTNLQATGSNLAGNTIDTTADIELPIASSDSVDVTTDGAVVKFKVSTVYDNSVTERINNAKPKEVQITAPDTSTNGTLSTEQMAVLNADKGAYLMFNNEVYRLQDSQHNTGYLVYTHIGYDNTASVYMIKCITVTVSNGGWSMTSRTVSDPNMYYTKTEIDTKLGTYATIVYVDQGLTGKLDKTGGTITGNLNVTGNLQKNGKNVTTATFSFNADTATLDITDL